MSYPPSRMDTMQTASILNGMKDMVDSLKKHPSKTFTLTEIAQQGLLPWARDGRTIRKVIEADFEGANILQAIVRGEGNQRRYLVTARNLIKYLQIYGPALIGTTRQLKNYVWQKNRKKQRWRSRCRQSTRTSTRHSAPSKAS